MHPLQRPLEYTVLTCAAALLLAACGSAAEPEDTRSPSVPGAVTAHASSATSVHVMWEESADDRGVTAYDVFRGGTKVTSVPAARHMTDVEGLNSSTRYAFSVRARDAAGNVSPRSTPVPVTTLAPVVADGLPPTRPDALRGRVDGARSVTLTWRASSDDAGVTAYDIYQRDSRVHTVPGSLTTAAVSGLRPGTVYTFTVRARDAADNSSAASVPLDLTTGSAPGSAPNTAPTGLTAAVYPEAASAHAVELTWKPPHTGAPVREHQLFLNGRFATTIVWGAQPPPGRASYRFTVTGGPGTRYALTLRARLPDGTWGDFSGQRTIVVP